MSVYKRESHWHYRFRVRRVRYRGALPEANTKWEAEQAESKIKQEIFEGRFGQVDLGSDKLADFIKDDFLPWSKANKRSWRHDEFRTRTICEFFGGKTFREISPLLVERFKRERRESITVRGSLRSPASVNHELELLSKIFNLAIDYGVTDTNPCRKVKKFALDNKRYRYLLPEEEPALMAVLSGPRAHLKAIVMVALGTAMKLAGISGLVWHDLRATFGTRLGEAGFDAFTIAALMGHSQIQTTARYVRATERNKRAAVESVMLDSQISGHKLDTDDKRSVSLAVVSR